ncbi:MAG: hypothetical protein JWN65_3194 [Solirubrobacterales bacterium]|nr:hypothetical protein [Solirubrobacterales bacterium]
MLHVTPRRLLLLGLLLPALGAVPSPAAADVAGPQLLSFLNAQRAAHGIPAGIVEDPALSDACAKHDRYGAANDDLAHQEDPLKPGFTAEGNDAAGKAVLYRGSTWSATANPFEVAPIHLHQLLSPFLDRAGGYETQGYGCVTTLASIGRPPEAVDTLYTYPRDGTTDWRASEIDTEGPFTPGQTVGIPQGTRTGPTLYVMVSGPGLRWTSGTKVLAASLTGPAGPVDIVTFDRSSPQIGAYLPAGAQLLPRAPLAAATTYTAAIRLQVTGDDGIPRELTRTWSFSTAAAAATLADTTGVALHSRQVTRRAGACSSALRFTGIRRSSGVRRLRVQATACRPTTLRVTIRPVGRKALTRRIGLKANGTHTVAIALPRRLRAGRCAVKITMAGAALSFTTRVPAVR